MAVGCHMTTAHHRACQLGDALPAGGDFLPPESHQRPPKAGPSPALWNPPRRYEAAWCVLLFSALVPVGSHRWRGSSAESACSSDKSYFHCQGLTLVSRCSQLSRAWLPAAGTPLLQGRPGDENHTAIGPAAMVAWCGGTNRGHSKGDGPNIGLTHSQPRTPGRYLGGKALGGFSSLLPGQKGPLAGSVPARLAGWNRARRSQSLVSVCPAGSQLSLHKGATKQGIQQKNGYRFDSASVFCLFYYS